MSKYRITLVRDETFTIEVGSSAEARAEVDRRRAEDPTIVDFESEEA